MEELPGFLTGPSTRVRSPTQQTRRPLDPGGLWQAPGHWVFTHTSLHPASIKTHTLPHQKAGFCTATFIPLHSNLNLDPGLPWETTLATA